VQVVCIGGPEKDRLVGDEQTVFFLLRLNVACWYYSGLFTVELAVVDTLLQLSLQSLFGRLPLPECADGLISLLDSSATQIYSHALTLVLFLSRTRHIDRLSDRRMNAYTVCAYARTNALSYWLSALRSAFEKACAVRLYTFVVYKTQARKTTVATMFLHPALCKHY
jgi:hypothetical protein